MQNQLIKIVFSFLHLRIIYSVRRLLAADMKNLYGGSASEYQTGINKRLEIFKKSNDEKNYKPHPTKGGLQINSYLTYNWFVF